MEIIATLVIGAIAGWLGSQIFKGSSLGIIWNIILGIVGSFVSGQLFSFLGINLGSGWIGAIISGAIGAIIVLFIINLITKKK